MLIEIRPGEKILSNCDSWETLNISRMFVAFMKGFCSKCQHLVYSIFGRILPFIFLYFELRILIYDCLFIPSSHINELACDEVA